jgi:hypothetical protein
MKEIIAQLPEDWEDLYELWKYEQISSKEFMDKCGLKPAEFKNLIADYLAEDGEISRNQRKIVLYDTDFGDMSDLFKSLYVLTGNADAKKYADALEMMALFMSHSDKIVIDVARENINFPQE